MTVTDLRWENVWAELRPYEQTAQELESNLMADCTLVYIEVIFEGIRFTSRQIVDNEVAKQTLFDLITYTLDYGVLRIDIMMEENGYPPYEIKDA